MKLVNKTINCIKNMKTYEILLVILMVLYLVTGVSTPYALAPYVNNMFMNASLIALVIVLYLYGNPLLALFVSTLILTSKDKFTYSKSKTKVFLGSVLLIIISEMSMRYISKENLTTMLLISMPFFLFMLTYYLMNKKLKQNLN